MVLWVPGRHRSNLRDAGLPLWSTPDGDCLFHALSTCLFGPRSESRGLEVKMRTLYWLCSNLQRLSSFEE
jgi:hypothetical protein